VDSRPLNWRLIITGRWTDASHREFSIALSRYTAFPAGEWIEKRASSFGSAVVWSVTLVCLWKEVV
jgi:hypothetical protein